MNGEMKRFLEGRENRNAIKILVIGASGFIGRHVAGALIASGSDVLAASRSGKKVSGATSVKIDLAQADDETLRQVLSEADVVVNCAGLVRNRGTNTMAQVHDQGVSRLIDACTDVGVRRLIHISALGASAGGGTLYQETKGAAEEHFHGLDKSKLDWCIVRPSLVVGRGGASTSMLTALAAMPWMFRLGNDTWKIQPVHISDITDLVVRLVHQSSTLPDRIDAVGPETMTTNELTKTLRAWLGFKPGHFLPMPDFALTAFAAIGEHISDGPANREVLAMLRQGISGDITAFSKALGRPPMSLKIALALQPASRSDRQAALTYFLRAPLRWCLGVMWLLTGIFSFGLYPQSGSLEMLAHLGVAGTPALVLLYGAAALDAILGLLLLIHWRPVAVGGIQLLAIAAFTLLATALPPEYWLHPFAPLVKNLPLFAATAIMMALEWEI